MSKYQKSKFESSFDKTLNKSLDKSQQNRSGVFKRKLSVIESHKGKNSSMREETQEHQASIAQSRELGVGAADPSSKSKPYTVKTNTLSLHSEKKGSDMKMASNMEMRAG